MNTKFIKLQLIISFLLFAKFAIFSQTITTSADSIFIAEKELTALAELQRDLFSLIENPDFSNAHIGVSIVSLETGESIFKHNETKNFIPASTQKLLTSAAALHYLGEDFRFSTRLYLDGILQSSGEFVGNIIIRGTGDPTLSELFISEPLSIFERWAFVLDSIGIRSIRGNIIGDDRYFDSQQYGPGWAYDDIIYPYSPQVSALSFNNNRVDLTIEPADSLGKNAKFYVSPDNSYINIINNIRTISDGDIAEVYHYREYGSNIIELFGGVNINNKSKNKVKISTTIDNPTLFYLHLFKSTLERNQIRHRGALLAASDWNERLNYASLQPLSEYFSPKLTDIISVLNKTSNNLIGEVLFKTIGKEQTGRGSFAAGAETLNKYCIRIGIAPEKMHVADGSGLSRHNLISPRYQTQLLAFVSRMPYFNAFFNSLAQPGKDGTLKNRLTSTLAENRLNAKTGSLNGVSTFSGYVKSSDNEVFAFSIMLMNYSVASSVAHNLQDLFAMRLASFSRKRK